MAIFFCDRCQKETKFLPIHATREAAGVSRSTMYYWMERAWIHWRELPSGRRIICQASLSRRAPELDADLHLENKNVSESVQRRPILRNPVG
jgi:predicted DNA-binding transcriptional regulator AlpA